MINVGRIVSGRNAQSFTVCRQSGSWQDEGWVQTENKIPFKGTITIAKGKDLAQIPEGDRTGGEIAVYSTQALYDTHAENDPITNAKPGTSDEVIWHKDRYRLFDVKPYVDYGYYKGIGIRMVGN